ncbi:glycosyl transferase family protein [Pseudoalteromonas sp. MMG010]|nr:glycosyl transferase family protein [Pseudoalteromonas sp. MMG010]
MSNDFSQYIKLIGKGKKAGKYLDFQQAQDAMSAVLEKKATAEQVGAFLMLLRVREESEQELAGFLTATKTKTMRSLSSLTPVDIDLGCYAGKRRHQFWLMLAIKTMVQHGYTFFLHGTSEPHSQRLYLKQVWQELGYEVSTTVEHANKMIATVGACYMDLAVINPALDELIQLRETLGLRSCANTLARMLNPSNAAVSLHGVYHRDFDLRHIEVAKLLNENNVACFRGDGGEIELNPERECIVHRVFNNHIESITFPQLLPSWQTKDRELSSAKLEQVWLAQQSDEYGEAAIIGTIAVMLYLIAPNSVEMCLNKAKQLWQQRDKNAQTQRSK